MGFVKYLRTCVHHYSITQGSFTTLLKALCVLPIHLSSLTFGTIDLIISIMLPFLECRIDSFLKYNRIRKFWNF